MAITFLSPLGLSQIPVGTDGATSNNERNADMGRINGLFSTGTFTAGSVLFANASGKIAQDPNQFTWDSAANRLGIGTASPGNMLHLSSTGLNIPQLRVTDTTTGCEATVGTTLNVLDVDVLPFTGGSPATIRMFRSTLTLGAVGLQILIGNDSNSINAQIGGSGLPTYFAALNGSVGIGTSSIDACAILEITSTTQGVMFPRMTTTQRNAIPSPLAGLQIFNSTLNVMQYRNSTGWMTYTATVSA